MRHFRRCSGQNLNLTVICALHILWYPEESGETAIHSPQNGGGGTVQAIYHLLTFIEHV